MDVRLEIVNFKISDWIIGDNLLIGVINPFGHKDRHHRDGGQKEFGGGLIAASQDRGPSADPLL